MMQKAQWKLNPFCSPFHNVEVLCGSGLGWWRPWLCGVRHLVVPVLFLHLSAGGWAHCSVNNRRKLATSFIFWSDNELVVSSCTSNCSSGVQINECNIWLPDGMSISGADFSSQPPGYVLIKQTKSELIATHSFLHKRSSGLKWNGI